MQIFDVTLSTLGRKLARKLLVLIKFIFNDPPVIGVAVCVPWLMGAGEVKQRNDRDMDIRTHPYPSEPISFYGETHYQLNERERKALEALTMMFYGFCRNTQAIKLQQTPTFTPCKKGKDWIMGFLCSRLTCKITAQNNRISLDIIICSKSEGVSSGREVATLLNC